MKVKVSIHRDFKISSIDERLYSAFIEHMGRAIYGGIYAPSHPQADEHGFRKDVLKFVRDLRIPAVRYPGGNFVSAYRWEDGVGPRENRPTRLDLAWRCTETNQVGINEFADWAKLANIEMMLAVNLGTRGLDDARNFLEYVNFPSGTALSELRRSHGKNAPHNVKLWCLGNEMDGPWQTGHKVAVEYGRLANETAKAFKNFDPSIETIVCGSSNDTMPTYPEWEREVLEESYENVDYISLHKYFENYEGDTLNFFGKIEETGRYIQAIAGTIDHIKAKKRAKNDVFICFDEWNVWYHQREEDNRRLKEWDYNFEDALFVAGLLNEFIRRSDRVKIACIAQLVNVIAPIRAEKNGPAWRQTIYHPYRLASLYGRGEALQVAVDAPTYNCAAADEVSYLDVASVYNCEENTLNFFIINRHLSEAAELKISLTGFTEPSLSEHLVMEGHDLQATNSAENPDNITPQREKNIAIEDGKVYGTLAPRSYHVLRLNVKRR